MSVCEITNAVAVLLLIEYTAVCMHEREIYVVLKIGCWLLPYKTFQDLGGFIYAGGVCVACSALFPWNCFRA